MNALTERMAKTGVSIRLTGLLVALGLAAPVAAHAAEVVDPVRPLIIGGSDSPQGELPWLVSIQRPDGNGKITHFCGGSMISPTVVLTAAHCVDDYAKGSGDPGELRFVVDRADLNRTRNGQERRVLKTRQSGYQVHVHPSWGSTGEWIDAAVVILDEPVRGVTPARLVTTGSDVLQRPGKLLTVAGWGNMSVDGSKYATHLQRVEVPVLANWECEYAYPDSSKSRGFNANTELCAGVGGRDSCQGDSGGPLFARMPNGGPVVQVGVVSWGKNCAAVGFPGLYAKVANPELNDWIHDFLPY